MIVPVRCPSCCGIAHFIRQPYSWITICHNCFFAEMKTDFFAFGYGKKAP